MSVARHVSSLAKDFTDSVPKSKLPAWLRQRCFKMTLWFTAAEYTMLMRQSVQLGSGKISVSKFLREAFSLEKAEDHVDARELRKVIRDMRVPVVEPDELTQRRQRGGLKAKRPRR